MYQLPANIRHIVLIEPGIVGVTRLTREADGSWSDTTHVDLTDTLAIDPPGVELPLVAIYDGLETQA